MLKFLSAQPDTAYFIWQLEAQLENFGQIGLDPVDIYILVGYDPLKGISDAFRLFAASNAHRANFFFYEDTRESKFYIPGVRPHIIAKHLQAFPSFNDSPVFYHDSDIIFTKYPDFSALLSDDTWYVSDTRKYLDSTYIRTYGQQVFEDMCRVVGIDEATVMANDEHAGGAQYIVKHTDISFWQQVEQDSEALYVHLAVNAHIYAAQYGGKTQGGEDYKPIQAWCADMWCLFWVALKTGRTVRVARAMYFIWPSTPYKAWEHIAIYHDAGVIEADRTIHFKKDEFRGRSPFFVNLDYVNPERSSFGYTQVLKAVAEKKQYGMPDMTIVLVLDSAVKKDVQVCKAVVRFLTNYFGTNIQLTEVNKQQQIIPGNLPAVVKYKFIPADDAGRDHAAIAENAVGEITTPFFLLYDWRIVVSPEKVYEKYLAIKAGTVDFAVPFNLTHGKAAPARVKKFIKSARINDLVNLHETIEKELSRQGAFMGHTQKYRSTALQRAKITGNTGLNWDERIFRMTHVGMDISYGNIEAYLLRPFPRNKQGAELDNNRRALIALTESAVA